MFLGKKILKIWPHCVSSLCDKYWLDPLYTSFTWKLAYPLVVQVAHIPLQGTTKVTKDIAYSSGKLETATRNYPSFSYFYFFCFFCHKNPDRSMIGCLCFCVMAHLFQIIEPVCHWNSPQKFATSSKKIIDHLSLSQFHSQNVKIWHLVNGRIINKRKKMSVQEGKLCTWSWYSALPSGQTSTRKNL